MGAVALASGPAFTTSLEVSGCFSAMMRELAA
jgi:hypothetical protein